MSEASEALDTLNSYPFTLLTDVPARPNNLYTEAQFKQAIESVLGDVDVSVSDRMTRTVAEATKTRVGDEVVAVTVSYRIFREEEHRYTGGNGWEVVMSCLDNLGCEIGQ